jgi:hypothetical protein
LSLVFNPDVHDTEIVLAQFHRLINDLIKGNFNRNTYQPWEIQILLDIQGTSEGDAAQRDLLKRYQKAVQRAYEKGAKMPMLLSEYLDSLKTRRTPGRSNLLELPMAANQ